MKAGYGNDDYVIARSRRRRSNLALRSFAPLRMTRSLAMTITSSRGEAEGSRLEGLLRRPFGPPRNDGIDSRFRGNDITSLRAQRSNLLCHPGGSRGLDSDFRRNDGFARNDGAKEFHGAKEFLQICREAYLKVSGGWGDEKIKTKLQVALFLRNPSVLYCCFYHLPDSDDHLSRKGKPVPDACSARGREFQAILI